MCAVSMPHLYRISGFDPALIRLCYGFAMALLWLSYAVSLFEALLIHASSVLCLTLK
jgi:hypothetical protein